MSIPKPTRSRLSNDDVRAVSPALANYTRDTIVADLWKRPGLSLRDRSAVTLAALIARAQTIGMQHYFNLALDNALKPAEVAEIITHLAFYSGWSNAFFAVEIVKVIFAERGIGAEHLPQEPVQLLPLDEAAEDKRATAVQANFGGVSHGVVDYTRDVLFRDLWLRPDLAPRDRSLITVSALVASGHVAQITYHLNRAMDNGLTQTEASEVLAHLAFYTGWPCVFSAMPVFRDVFTSRTK